jgi:hypothetical protein
MAEAESIWSCTTKMVDQDSLARAKYALLVLRNARGSERESAIKLIQSLANDAPRWDTAESIAKIHRDAVRTFNDLLDYLRNSKEASRQWQTAVRATQQWLDVLE